jgi:transposase
LCDSHGIPLAVIIAPAQRNDIKLALPTIDALRIGSIVMRPKRLGADKGYDSNKLGLDLLQRGIQPYLVPRQFQKKIRHSLKRPPGRPCDQRWKVERAHAWQNQQRRIAGFYEKTRDAYEAFVTLAFIRLYLRRLFKGGVR